LATKCGAAEPPKFLFAGAATAPLPPCSAALNELFIYISPLLFVGEMYIKGLIIINHLIIHPTQ